MLYKLYADPKGTLLPFAHFVRAFDKNWKSHSDLSAEGPQVFLDGFLGFF